MKRTIVSVMLATAAMAMPSVNGASEKNLENYLEYLFESKLDLNCTKSAQAFICQTGKTHFEEQLEEDVAIKIGFDGMTITYDDTVEASFAKVPFAEAMKSLTSYEARVAKHGPMGAGQKPNTLERSLLNASRKITVDDLMYQDAMNLSKLTIRSIIINNDLKKQTKKVSYDNRVLGDLSIEYFDMQSDAETSMQFIAQLPSMVETLLGTNDMNRSKYVMDQMRAMYQDELEAPTNGKVAVATRYLGNDKVSITIDGTSVNTKGTESAVRFSGEIRGASALFNDEQNLSAPVMPDFVLGVFGVFSKTDTTDYVALLKKDKKLNKYLNEYVDLMTSRYDAAIKGINLNPTIMKWLGEFKTVFAKSLLGEVSSMDLQIKNKSGIAMSQVVGLFMAQMMAGAGDPGSQPDQAKLISDLVAQNLDVTITTK